MPENRELAPYVEQPKSPCIWKNCAKLLNQFSLSSQIGNLIAKPFNSVSRIFSNFPDMSFNCDIKANFSINSRKSMDENEGRDLEKSCRCDKIQTLEQEIDFLRRKLEK